MPPPVCDNHQMDAVVMCYDGKLWCGNVFEHTSNIDFGLHLTFNQFLDITMAAIHILLVHMNPIPMDFMLISSMHNCALTTLTTRCAPQAWMKLMCSFFACTGVQSMVT